MDTLENKPADKGGYEQIQPGNIEVTGVASTVANGEVVCSLSPLFRVPNLCY